MKKLISTLFAVSLVLMSIAQAPAKDWKKAYFNQPGDHIMVQLTSDHWAGAPDSISNRMTGLSRGFGLSVMLNKPFRTNPHWSVAFGLGVNASSMFFKNTLIDITAGGTVLPFTNVDSVNHFKKYKLVTAYAEIPVELRYIFNPEKASKSWKIALGAKIGTLINAHTKAKTLVNSAGVELNSYTMKESKKSFFNSTRLAATARVGIGAFSLTGTYAISSLLKDGAGANIHPFQIGLCMSGL